MEKETKRQELYRSLTPEPPSNLITGSLFTVTPNS